MITRRTDCLCRFTTKDRYVLTSGTGWPGSLLRSPGVLWQSRDVVIAFFFIFGIVIGSFLNVCITRIPEGVSIVTPGSRCPRCEAPIKAYDNVPVFAWLWLRGKCRSCGYPISPCIHWWNC